MALPNPPNNVPQIIDVQNPSSNHHVVSVKMPTNLASKWPSKPWGTPIEDIGLSTKDAALYPDYVLVEVEPIKNTPDLLWIFQKLNGPEWSTKSIGQESLIPAKFRKSVTTTITTQDVESDTQPSALTGDLILSSVKQVENSGVAKLQNINEVIDLNADPLVSPSTEDQLYVTTEKIVTEQTPSEEGFGIVQSTVQALGNGKAVMITKRAVNTYSGESDGFDIGFSTLEGNGFDSRYGVPINIELTKVSTDDVITDPNPEIVGDQVTVITRTPESVWHAKQEKKTYTLPEDQIWYGLRRATNFPKVLQEIITVDSNENPTLVPVFKADIDGILKARWTRKFSYGPPILPDPVGVYAGRIYRTEEYVFLTEYERSSQSQTISNGSNTSGGVNSSVSQNTSESNSSQTSSSQNTGTSQQTNAGVNTSTSNNVGESTGTQTSQSTSNNNSTTSSTNTSSQDSNNTSSSTSNSSGTSQSTNVTSQTSDNSGTQNSIGSQTQTSTNTGTSNGTQAGTSNSNSSNFSFSAGVSFNSSESTETSGTQTGVANKGTPMPGTNTIIRNTATSTETLSNTGSSGNNSSNTTSNTVGSSTSSGTSSSTSNGTSTTTSDGTSSSSNTGSSTSDSNSSQTSISQNTSVSNNVGSGNSVSSGISTSNNIGISNSGSISSSTSTNTSESTSEGSSTGTTSSTNNGTSNSFGTSNSISNNLSNSTSTSTSSSTTETISIGNSIVTLRIPACLRSAINFTILGSTYTIPATSPVDIIRDSWVIEDIATNHWQDGIWVTEIVEVYVPA